MRKATFYNIKGRLLACKRRPFAMCWMPVRCAAGWQPCLDLFLQGYFAAVVNGIVKLVEHD